MAASETTGARDPAAEPVRIGEYTDWYEGRVDPDAALAYANATNEPNDCYARGLAVPPLFTAALTLEAQGQVHRSHVDMDAIPGVRAGVHAEHDVSFARPLRPGMALRWQASSHSIRPTPVGPMITIHVNVTDGEGQPLVEHLWSSIFIGGRYDARLGPELPDHAFPEAARAKPIGRVGFDVTRDQGFRYGGASGDRPPHALDDVWAQAEGFEGKILQGMCTFAMCSGAVVKELAGGDPDKLRRLAGRFASPVRPGHELAVELYDAGPCPDGGRAVVFEATSEGDTVVKHGRAELL